MTRAKPNPGPVDAATDTATADEVEGPVDPTVPVDASCRKPFVVDGRRVSLAEYVAWERKQRRAAVVEELRSTPVPQPPAPKE